MPPAIGLDFETFYDSRKSVQYSVKNLITEQYVKDPRFDAYLLSACDGESSWAGHPKDFNWDVLEGRTVVSHNKYFDCQVWDRLAELGKCPPPKPAAYHCTANLTAFICNRRPLDQSVEHLFKVTLDKSARGEASGRTFESYPQAEREKMLEYARKDAYWCWKLWDTYSPKWPEVERRLSNLTIAQGMKGVAINRELLNEYIVNTFDALEKTKEHIPWIKDAEDDSWDDFNTKPTSIKCIAEQCRRMGIPCPPVKAHEGEEAYIEWEETHAPTNPWITCLSSYRSLNKLYQTFMEVKARLRPDGTMPFALLYFGAHTGRWAATAKINMQNPRKEPVLINELGLMEVKEKRIAHALKFCDENGKYPEWVRCEIHFRNLIIPRPGKKMIVSDLSQIEPRVLAWLAGDEEWLRLVRTGLSPYEAHARVAYKWSGEDLKHTDPKLYATCKAARLGLGFGCGWEKFIKMSMTLAGLDLTEDDPEFIEDPETGVQVSGYGSTSKRIVGEFRQQNKKIVELWERLDDGFRRSAMKGEDFVMELPGGRKMIYEDVRQSVAKKQNPKTKKIENKYVFTASIGGKRRECYGGKLTENVTQAVARDVFGEHLVALEDNNWWPLFSTHDEAILEVDQDVTAKDVEHVMSKCPEWLKGCPIGAEAKEVEHYCK